VGGNRAFQEIILNVELIRLPWQIKQPIVHTQKGVKALLISHLSRLNGSTQGFVQSFPK
jgi:hypothetical protein